MKGKHPCASKRRYGSLGEALLVARVYSARYATPARPYLCPCGAWHLTTH
jgi:hypothetical protein